MNSPNGLQNKNVFKPKFNQAVLLRQSPVWSRGIIWVIVGLIGSGIGWAYFCQIEQVVSATGQLKPQGSVKEVQVPINGINAVVKKVLVKEGDHVKAGDVVLILDSTTSQTELKSLQAIRQSLRQENDFYLTLLKQSVETEQVEARIAQLNLPKEIVSLTRNRSELITENQLLRVQLGGNSKNIYLTAQQRARLQAARAEFDSRISAAILGISQLQKQLAQNDAQLKAARINLETAKTILHEIEPLVQEGAFSRLKYVEQKQAVATQQSEVERSLEEQQRIELDIAQAKEELKNTKALTQKDVLQQISSNQREIATIDSQLNRRIIDNKKQLAELDGQIGRVNQTLKYQEFRAPASGTVFDMHVSPGIVLEATRAEPVLKIVPDDYLIAETYVGNSDIGFVRKDMAAEIRIGAFPYTEFGDIKGKVIFIGSDSLPPDSNYSTYRFPVKISLAQQALVVEGKKLLLQSGMSVNVKIRVREHRTVLSLLVEQFTRQVESIEEIK